MFPGIFIFTVMKKQNLRSMAAQAVEQVIEQGQSLSNVLPPLQLKVSDKDKALLQELCFGVLRTLSQLEWLINKLMSRPMTGKQRTVHYLIMVGFYQLLHTRIPPHAALAETVEGAVAIKRPQLKGLINGVLRQFQRQQEELLAEFAQSEARFLHPDWLLKRLKKAYPDAVRLASPAPVHALPGFDEGWVTVQDASAQGCMTWLEPKNGEQILDLCAAPGGKTTHILEVAPQASVMAVDVDEQRLSRVYDNLKRLGMKAQVKQGDGRKPAEWCGETQFDRILLDAPCSATGVIRRHPDIKWLRRDRDIQELAQLQSDILDAIWPHLKSGGTLVYATCSVLPEENSQQIAAFLKRTPDAALRDTGTPESPGLQNLPGAEEGDGFFYAKLIKE